METQDLIRGDMKNSLKKNRAGEWEPASAWVIRWHCTYETVSPDADGDH